MRTRQTMKRWGLQVFVEQQKTYEMLPKSRDIPNYILLNKFRTEIFNFSTFTFQKIQDCNDMAYQYDFPEL